jgi:single-stranded DNA-binding protein
VLNKVFLCGTLSDRGVTVRPLPESGTMVASFTLQVTEDGAEGKTFATWLPCEAFGKAREHAEQLAPGAVVLVEGKLKRRARHTKGGEQYYDTVVLAWSIQRVHSALVAQEV